LEQILKTRIEAIVDRVAPQDTEVLHGKAVIEIKSSRFSKGTAVHELMKRVPFVGRKPIFIGDDTTDVSVFEILPALGGIGYAVERCMPGAHGTFGFLARSAAGSPVFASAWGTIGNERFRARSGGHRQRPHGCFA
jgi:trehalose-phosphatase